MNIRKKIVAVLCATALAVTGSVAIASTASAKPSMGTGIVDIETLYSYSYCTAHGFPGGSCGSYGTGIVVPNVWSENEVVVPYHVIQGHASGDSVLVKDPFTGHIDYGYVQKTDATSDLAVVWLYKSWSAGGGFVGSDYTWTTAPITSALDNQTWNGTSVVVEGDGGGDSFINNHDFHTTYGTVTNQDKYSQAFVRPYDGTTDTLYHTVVTSTATIGGDSGGATINNSFGDPNYQTVFAMLSGGTGSESNSIPIHWAIWDMLHVHP